jgi:hypothetical protein
VIHITTKPVDCQGLVTELDERRTKKCWKTVNAWRDVTVSVSSCEYRHPTRNNSTDVLLVQGGCAKGVECLQSVEWLTDVVKGGV